LGQALLYLLQNASKFTLEGGEFGVTVNGTRDEHLAAIAVWDMGIGIKDEGLSKLFKPFVQLDARLERQYEGSGLGLALVKQMSELLGGEVSVTSVFDQGSRFTVTLPWKE
jgi:signal transduction histidine kinase